jgi:hypothetical protein
MNILFTNDIEAQPEKTAAAAARARPDVWCTMNPAYCDAVISWLQIILYQRFGHRFTFSQTDPNWVRIGVAGRPGTIRIASDATTFTRADSDLRFTQWDGAAEGWIMPLGKSLPAPGVSSLPDPLIQKCNTGFTFYYDVLGLAYWMLSRQEEVGRSDLDHHHRFPARSSHASKHDYLERPIVDEWFDVLSQAMQKLWPGLPLTRHTFVMRVSHDVDYPSRYAFTSFKHLLRIMASDAIRGYQRLNMLRAPLSWLRTDIRLYQGDPFNTFDWIMDRSELHGLTSAFYFICGRTDPALDARYEPEHRAIRELMRRIHARGHEIGLHPSYNTYKSPETLVSEANRLKMVCSQESIEQAQWGGRMHFLRWNTPTTLYGWEQAGMTYDSTLSYADRPGFRCGTCLEYPAFDPVRKKMLNVRIRPLVAMECTVMAERYLGLGSGDAAREKFVQLKDACRAVNGVFTLLWHNSELDTKQKRQLYASLLSA